MNINPSYESIGSIFEQNILLEVPKYQRYYAWDDEQIDDFIKDIKNAYNHRRAGKSIQHFFGGIVVVKKTVPGSTRQQRELIDGQQRITTAILLIVSVINKLQSLINSDNKDNIEYFINQLRTRYLTYPDRINRIPMPVPKLVLSNADNQFFDDIVNFRALNDTRDSHKKLKKAYKKLLKLVDEVVDNIPDIDGKLDALSDFDNVINTDCTIIFIDADTRESAFKLFQVLNDRGAGLTEGDLLKSKTLEVLEKHFPVKQESLQISWDSILSDEPKQVETFLRYYFASVCGYRVGRTTMYDEYLSNFFPKLVDNDELTEETDAIHLCGTVSTLLDEMKRYKKINNGEWPYPVAQPITEWERNRLFVLVNYLNFDIVYPLLMAATYLNQKKFFEIVYMLEKFMFRYKSVCNFGHQKLSEIFISESVRIRNNPNEYRTSSLRSQLKKILDSECNDAIFKVNLSGLRYRQTGGNKTLKYFFSMLECHLDWYNAGAVGKPRSQTNSITAYENISIEHISSQSPDVPQLFSGDDVHKLKNLTILTPTENDNVGNKIYTDKKSTYLISCYKINKYFENVDEWIIPKSNEWQEYIADFACKVFTV